MSNINFGALLTRNFDGVCFETSQKVMAGYDREIQRLTKQKENAAELDTFMSSKEISQLTKQLPKRDLVDIRQAVEYDQEQESASLQYLVREDKSLEKLFKTTIHPEKKDDLAFTDVRNEDGSLNKEGIKSWLNHLVDFFCEKK